MADAAGTITTETDVLAEPVAYTDVFGNRTTTSYDDQGREKATVSSVGTIDKSYDNADRLTGLSRNGQLVASNLVYDNASRLTAITYSAGTGNAGNGTVGSFGYDIHGRPASIGWTSSDGTTITSDAVTRRLGGDVIEQIVDGADYHPGDDYTYDAAGRLTEGWVPGRHVSYRFNPTEGCGPATNAGMNSNRTHQLIEGGGLTCYCYDYADRLLAADDYAGTITYDGHGNTTSIFGETHSYDAADRHMQTVKGATTVAYTRDATDRIVDRKVNGTTIARYGNTGTGDIPKFTTDIANHVLDVTYALPGGALLTTRASGDLWSYPNIHGDLVALADQAGTKQGSTITYDPFGNLVTGGQPDNSTGNFDYGWLGKPQRPTEHEPNLQPIIEMGARQYSPILGRFLEVDPVEGGSANDYDYVNADPVNKFDLGGTWFRARAIRKAARSLRKASRLAVQRPRPVIKQSVRRAATKAKARAASSTARGKAQPAVKAAKSGGGCVAVNGSNGSTYPAPCPPGGKSGGSILDAVGAAINYALSNFQSCLDGGEIGLFLGLVAAMFAGPFAPAVPPAGAALGCAGGVALDTWISNQ